MKQILSIVLLVACAYAQGPKIPVSAGGSGAPNATNALTGSGAQLDITHTFSAAAAAKAVVDCYTSAGVKIPGNSPTITVTHPNSTTLRVTFSASQSAGTYCNANATGTGSTGADGTSVVTADVGGGLSIRGATPKSGLSLNLRTFAATAPLTVTQTSDLITWNMPAAASGIAGHLTAADWATFNAKENALTFSAPLSRSTNSISIPVATSSVNGYLSSTDWTTFNNKYGSGSSPSFAALTLSGNFTRTGMTDGCASWSGGILVSLGVACGSGTGGGAWGSITGTLSSQTDLNTALNARLAAASNLSDLANAATARTNLGLAIGTNVQAFHANLSTLAGKTIVGNGTDFRLSTGVFSTNDCVKVDANGNLASAGAPCGSGGSGATPVGKNFSSAQYWVYPYSEHGIASCDAAITVTISGDVETPIRTRCAPGTETVDGQSLVQYDRLVSWNSAQSGRMALTTGGSVTGGLLAANNLSDVVSASTARTNIGAAPLVSPAFTGTVTLPSTSGNTTTYVTTTGAQTSGRCVEIDANGNHIAASGACGGSSSITSSTQYKIPVYNSAGTGLEGNAYSCTIDSNGLSCGDGTVVGESKMLELLVNGSNYFSWLAPDAITNTIRYKLADTSPTAGQVMAFGAPSSNISQQSWVSIQPLDSELTAIAALAPTDDSIIVYNGTAPQLKAIPDCDDSNGQHLNYDTATNAWSCGTTGAGDVVGPGSSSNGQLVAFLGTTGKVIQAVTGSGIVKVASGVPAVATPGTDYTTPSSTETETNKTIDAEGTGNTITIPFKYYFEAAGCQNTTASLMWDTPTSNPAVAACVTGTNTQKGVAEFADSANLSMQRTYLLPSDWTGNIDVKFKWTTTATTGSVVWQIATACVADAETDDPSFNTASTVTDAAKGTTLQTNDASISAVTVTGCAAGELIHLKVSRDSAHASDDLAATARLIGMEMTLRRSM